MIFNVKKLGEERNKAGLKHHDVQEAAKKSGIRGLKQSSLSQKEKGIIPVSNTDMEFLSELYTGKKDVSIFFDFDGEETVLMEKERQMESDLKKWIKRYGDLADDYARLRRDYEKARKILRELEGLEGKEQSGLG